MFGGEHIFDIEKVEGLRLCAVTENRLDCWQQRRIGEVGIAGKGSAGDVGAEFFKMFVVNDAKFAAFELWPIRKNTEIESELRTEFNC